MQADVAFATGMVNDSTFVTELPFALTSELLQRGRERYGIFCAVCHDATGSGRGMVVRRGYKQPQALLEGLRQQPAVRLFSPHIHETFQPQMLHSRPVVLLP